MLSFQLVNTYQISHIHKPFPICNS